MVETVRCDVVVRCRVEREIEANCPIIAESDAYEITIAWTPSGETYEKHALDAWLDSYAGCEMTHEDLCWHLYDDLDGAAVADLRVKVQDTKHLDMMVSKG